MELPETLIYRIQSLLAGKDAARTTLISKSWHTAWSTRPAIEIDESHFPQLDDRLEIDRLVEFAKKTFRRYEESNLNIDTFTLCLSNELYARFDLATEWTLKALKLGATDLTFRFPGRKFDVPLNQVFGNENVQRLCLHHLGIDKLKVNQLTRLMSLTLSDMAIKTDHFFDILSCFPLIEYLSLSDIHRIMYSSLSDFHRAYDSRVVRTSPPKIILPKLRSLVLSQFESQIQIKTLFLDDLSSKFPNLKDLTLAIIFPYESIQNISSGTLETLNLRYVDSNRYYPKPGVELDVPSIRKFTFEGKCVPNLSFSSKSTDQWVSHLSIRNPADMSTMWFFELSEFVTRLKESKIHLCLHLHFKKSFDYEVGEMDCVNVFEVDDLTLDTKGFPSLSCGFFLDALFRTCHPKMISQYHDVNPPTNDMRNDDGGNSRNNDLFICRTLEWAMRVRSVLLPTQLMYGLSDLEELDVQQLFDEVWKTQPLSSILDDSTSEQRRFRFRLKWKSSLNQYMRRPYVVVGVDDDDDMDGGII